MAFCALELEELLKLMAADIDNDTPFFRVDKYYSQQENLYADGHPAPKSLYLGAVDFIGDED